MVKRSFVLSGVMALIVLAGCDPDGGPAPGPLTPAFPTAMPSDPPAMFDRWKEIVSNPESAGGSMAHVEIAMALKNREPAYVAKMVDMLVDPATTPQSRFLIFNSLEVAQTPELYPRLLGLTNPEIEPSIRAGTVIMLKNAEDPTVTARIRELTNDPEGRVRMAALMILTENGDKETRAKLIEYYFKDGLPPEHRARIVQSLALAPEPGDLKVFEVAVNDPTLAEEPRLVSTGAIGGIGDPAGIEPLKRCAEENNSQRLKEAAAAAARLLAENTANRGAAEGGGK